MVMVFWKQSGRFISNEPIHDKYTVTTVFKTQKAAISQEKLVLLLLFLRKNIYDALLIWYQLNNLRNVEIIDGEMLLLVKLNKVTLLHGGFSRFLNCTNCTKKAYKLQP